MTANTDAPVNTVSSLAQRALITAMDLPDPALEPIIERCREQVSAKGYMALIEVVHDAQRQGHTDRRLAYFEALALRHLGRVDDALALLNDLIVKQPRYSRAYLELGHCYVAKRAADQAIHHYQKAVEINPALPSVWEQLAGLYRMVGEPARAQAALQQAMTIRQMPEPVIVATGWFVDGELVQAEQLTRDYIAKHGDHFEAMRLLARIGAAMEIYDDAEILLKEVVKRVPDYHAARQDLACVLLDRHKYAEAHQELVQLVQQFPDNAHFQTLMATAVVGLGQHRQAIELYKKALLAGNKDARALAEIELSIAHSHKTIGATPQAIEHYRRAIQHRGEYGDAYWSLANLKTYRFTDREIESMAAAITKPHIALDDQIHLSFALAKGYEDREEYAQAWHYYELGNQLKRQNSRYRPEVIELNTHNQKTVCTQAFFSARQQFGRDVRTPIFILGLPRSGSTLLEQILASHSQVEGTQELANIPRLVVELQGRNPDLNDPKYPKVLAELPAEFFIQQADQYLHDTSVYRSQKPHFIDKMPNNFRHIGLIHLMFPNAAIIDARREPMACCFGNFKQLFARGQEFSYSIEDIARYYRTYLELMEHWDTVLPGRVLRVHHGDVVADLDSSVRRILDYCGLPFEPQCLEFYKTNRSVRTASSEQVRQPIYTEGMEQWRHFEPWLSPLRLKLGDALTRFKSPAHG